MLVDPKSSMQEPQRKETTYKRLFSLAVFLTFPAYIHQGRLENLQSRPFSVYMNRYPNTHSWLKFLKSKSREIWIVAAKNSGNFSVLLLLPLVMGCCWPDIMKLRYSNDPEDGRDGGGGGGVVDDGLGGGSTEVLGHGFPKRQLLLKLWFFRSYL